MCTSTAIRAYAFGMQAPTQATRPTKPADRRHPAASAAVAVIAQCEAFVESLGDEAYVQPSSALQQSTIGQHVRHALDHFTAALAGADGQPIEYDRRKRGGTVETDRAQAMQGLAEVRQRLAAIDTDQAERSVRIRAMLSADGVEAELSSTLARELAFAAHHAVHHQAMMAAIARQQGLSTPSGFGRAPATLNYEASTER